MGPKKNRTVTEQQWFDSIASLGCIVCRLQGHGFRPASIHHMLRGSVRISEFHTLPLCWDHHQSGRNDAEIVSRHPWRSRFEREYGRESYLLEKVRELVRDRGLPVPAMQDPPTKTVPRPLKGIA